MSRRSPTRSPSPDTSFSAVSRRDALRAGAVGGLSLASAVAAQPTLAAQPIALHSARPASFGRAKSVILFLLTGGPSQHDTWDPKPDAPAEVRGEFQPIATATPGLSVGELMPLTARLTDRIAVIRSMRSGDNNHSSSGYQLLTGVPHVPLGVENAVKKAPNLWPCGGAIVRSLRPHSGSLPSAVTLPEHIWNDGNISWPGQDAGFLGLKHDPWLIQCDPSQPNFQIDSLKLPDELSGPRFAERRELLSLLNFRVDPWASTAETAPYDTHSRQAVDMLTSLNSRGAFNLGQEAAATRDRYGRTRFGQSTLLARRLVESGVLLVQVNFTRMIQLKNKGWDTHDDHHKQARTLMPIMDQTYSALIEDLEQRGLLDETLVVWAGEFGRSPKVNGRAGRDHWGHCFSLALAGGGVRGGIVYGSSDRLGAQVASDVVSPADLWATIYHALGIDPETLMHDQLGRPLPISRGTVLRDVLV